jgi:1-aminocyclopropane-1-carboxylate deaminase/D-cysteine desulfhydrase-like pyridoxal-dependent ACC family enzyme
MASTGNWCALAHQLARGGWRRALTHALAVTARRNYQILRSQLGAGYGAPTATGLEAARLAARHDGLLLDHTYTAKAMAGLVPGIRGGTYTHQDRVVFFHTGGLAGCLAAAATPAHSP